ncbi:HNH endonuclease [Cypionkella sp.]|uniref:HNH endonuclease n=1 Tax=Cypionkella sp. TaxID=2811411 RepID=UPI002ABB65D2|nr:HNH endonuclease [Cypionkella sp.]MDZ4394088.1 HNH endonuclease [Cypionkella sp.]
MNYPRAGGGLYKTQAWKVARKAAKDRDGWKCVKCGARGRLEVDHIKGLRNGGDPFDLSNLQTLCVSCHSKKTHAEIFGECDPERVRWRELLARGL